MKLTGKIRAYIVVSIVYSLMCSCSEEERSLQNIESENIGFQFSVSGKWEISTPTRSTEEKESDCMTVKFKDSDLWLVPSVEEGITLAPSREDVPLTRGTVITEDNFYPSFRMYGYRFGKG